MDSLWPWLAVAGAGALHGVNPASGWLFAACGPRLDGRSRPLRALATIAVAHLAAVAMVLLMLGGVPATSPSRLAVDPLVLQGLAAVLLLLPPALHAVRGQAPGRAWGMLGHAGLALWVFAVSTGHGAGLMLVPLLAPLCASAGPAQQSMAAGAVLLALAVHLAGMLAATTLMSAGARRGWDALARWMKGRVDSAVTDG
ncbi:hypothetical protein GCM10027034_26770 [Ramlibacter solisilvae]|uniref:Uncharacterized protein n=1 Tax=Ramlibacter tataouinensis TaxID=94132 RepID=A0A127JWD8_9BURK|nr:hypothetical protein [Ramlibacter tataouinensis]AMO22342.1 hypothetical protein UC35_04815 [Ramlibacter tataouinensis]